MIATSVDADLGAVDGLLADRLLIRELVENWVLWRDAGEWDRFATLWHDDGRMIATWFQADAGEFIARSRRAFDGGLVGVHMLGGCSIDVEGARAVAQTKMQIVQHGRIDGVEVDVRCYGRFVDALEKRRGRWGLVQRQPVYELDSLALTDPSETLEIDRAVLDQFPFGYRHLGYLQTKMGFEVSRSLPGTRGSEAEALKARSRRWLAGDAASCLAA